jgi:hypothetical protein
MVAFVVDPILSNSLWLNAVDDGVTVPDIADPVLTLDETVKLEDRAILGNVIVWLTDIVPTE